MDLVAPLFTTTCQIPALEDSSQLPSAHERHAQPCPTLTPLNSIIAESIYLVSCALIRERPVSPGVMPFFQNKYSIDQSSLQVKAFSGVNRELPETLTVALWSHLYALRKAIISEVWRINWVKYPIVSDHEKCYKSLVSFDSAAHESAFCLFLCSSQLLKNSLYLNITHHSQHLGFKEEYWPHCQMFPKGYIFTLTEA